MDLKIIETDNGGDIVTTQKDVLVIYGFENMAYLAMFGGNTRASTPRQRLETEQAFDFWGNSMYPDDPSIQFNSETEHVLNNTPLTSSGRELIVESVKRDLDFMRPFAKVGVAVSIIATDKVLIGIALQQPDNSEQRQFIYIWDATRKEVILPHRSNVNQGVAIVEGFQYELDFDFEP